MPRWPLLTQNSYMSTIYHIDDACLDCAFVWVWTGPCCLFRRYWELLADEDGRVVCLYLPSRLGLQESLQARPSCRFLGPVPVPPLPLQLSPVCVFTCDPQIPPTHPILPFLNNNFTDALFSVLPRESTKSLQMIQNALSLNTYRRIWSYETNPSLTALASSSCQIRL